MSEEKHTKISIGWWEILIIGLVICGIIETINRTKNNTPKIEIKKEQLGHYAEHLKNIGQQFDEYGDNNADSIKLIIYNPSGSEGIFRIK